MKPGVKTFLASISFIVLYVLLGNARGVQASPFIDGASIAVNMIVPVLAGIMLGMRSGAAVGFFGTLINAFTPAGSYFELAAVFGHTAMGFSAGIWQKQMKNTFISASSIFLGHILNIVVFVSAGLLSFSQIQTSMFWQSLAIEAAIGIITIYVVYKLLMLIQEPVPTAESKPRRQASLKIGVWKILAVIALILVGLFVLFFSFPMISVTMVIGAALLMLAEKLRLDFESWAAARRIRPLTKKIYGHFLWIFWAIIIIVLISWTTSSVTGAITDLGTNDPSDYIESVQGYLPSFVTEYILTESAIEQIERTIFSLFANVITNATTFMLNAIIIIPLMFITYYRRRHEITEGLSQFIPEKIRIDVMEMIYRTNTQLKTFTQAKLIESLIVGLICVIGFFVAGIEAFVLLGLLAGLLNIIPYVGPLLGSVPALLLATTQAPVASLIVLITVIIAQLIDNLYLQPFMISGQVQINPLLSVIITLIGAQSLGVLGMLFAIPVYLVFKLVLGESHRILVEYAQ